MPLVFVSIFYILIAKHLFKTKSVILKPLSSQSFINERNNSKGSQLNIKPVKQISKNNSQEKLPKRSLILDNEKLMNKLTSTSSSVSLNNHTRRTRDSCYGNSTVNNLAIHTLYQDVKTRKQLRARHKVAKTVLFLCSVFFICWLPKQIHDLYW